MQWRTGSFQKKKKKQQKIEDKIHFVAKINCPIACIYV